MAWILIAPMLLLTFAAQDLPDPQTLRSRMQEAARQRQSIQYVRELTGEVFLDGNPVREVNAAGRRVPVAAEVGRQTVALVNPGKVRVDLELGGGNLMVSDGETTWTYRPSTNLYTKIAAGQSADSVATGLAVLNVMGFFEDAASARTVGEESIEVDGATYDCWVVTSSVNIPEQAAMGGEISEGLLTAWIDKELMMAIRETITYAVKVAPEAGADAVEYRAKLTQTTRFLAVDQPIEAELFAFVPPPDAREQAAQVAGRVDLTGTDAPIFRGIGLDGRAYNLEALRGRTVLLDFWASWCGPCIRSMPVIDQLHAQYASQGLVILAVNVGESRQTVETFLETRTKPYPVVMGDEAGIPAAYSVTVFPTFVLIGPDGRIAAHQFGFNEAALAGIAASAGLTPPE